MTKLNKQKLISIFKSHKFDFEVPDPYRKLFLGEYPEIAKGYYFNSYGTIIYVDYEISSSYSTSWSLVIEITHDGCCSIKFDDDDGLAKWTIEELDNSKNTAWRRLQ